ncbi:hypothetical protein BJ508DRAFT_329783 [Ascobolus immersus RN42]|uniref:Uncharacterized protein n=1 Tax=Ascobolus immersus RN42 TaxID=1160509 RepID=A0A3N4I1C2_ASCIM|nr:hypothetical protein BJ508DRAFT_329783 [Ascobolus immersus RN42]
MSDTQSHFDKLRKEESTRIAASFAIRLDFKTAKLATPTAHTRLIEESKKLSPTGSHAIGRYSIEPLFFLFVSFGQSEIREERAEAPREEQPEEEYSDEEYFEDCETFGQTLQEIDEHFLPASSPRHLFLIEAKKPLPTRALFRAAALVIVAPKNSFVQTPLVLARAQAILEHTSIASCRQYLYNAKKRKDKLSGLLSAAELVKNF